MFTHLCIYIYVYIYTYMCVFMYKYVQIYIYIYMYVYMLTKSHLSEPHTRENITYIKITLISLSNLKIYLCAQLRGVRHITLPAKRIIIVLIFALILTRNKKKKGEKRKNLSLITSEENWQTC